MEEKVLSLKSISVGSVEKQYSKFHTERRKNFALISVVSLGGIRIRKNSRDVQKVVLFVLFAVQLLYPIDARIENIVLVLAMARRDPEVYHES
ncbi:MAG: hypothetical protein NC177_16795 [Ruminococcus flavefaciens]|nr:hypothetical protein [Ruminococcus flavefaciens]